MIASSFPPLGTPRAGSRPAKESTRHAWRKARGAGRPGPGMAQHHGPRRSDDPCRPDSHAGGSRSLAPGPRDEGHQERKLPSGLVVWIWFALVARPAMAQGVGYPPPLEGDYVISDFPFHTGETLPQLRLHYRTIGAPSRDAAGTVRNAVLILHGTTGSGGGFLTPAF